MSTLSDTERGPVSLGEKLKGVLLILLKRWGVYFYTGLNNAL